MPKIFYYSDGTPSPHPVTKDHAKRLRRLNYDDGVLCEQCQDCSVKFTLNDRCKHCARLEALAFYNSAVLGQPAEQMTAGMQEAAEVLLSEMPHDHTLAPGSPETALQMGAGVWVCMEYCGKAGHIGVRTLEGECYFCLQAQGPSPRQQAIAAGQEWYTPAEACQACGQRAPRRVNNGQCSGCRPAAPRSLAASIMEDTPTLILHRRDARAAGLPVYRTGRPCRYGHRGFRYTSTGACVDCLREGG